MNKWKFCVIDPQDAVLALCGGSMDEGDGKSCGFGNGYGMGYGNGSGGGMGMGDGYSYGWVVRYGDEDGDGSSPEEWK